jgi:hypothetical protein
MPLTVISIHNHQPIVEHGEALIVDWDDVADHHQYAVMIHALVEQARVNCKRRDRRQLLPVLASIQERLEDIWGKGFFGYT